MPRGNMKTLPLKNLKISFLSLLFLSILHQQSFAQCDDRDALVAIYNATDGANWTEPWDLNADITTWAGVTLNADGCVIGLNLSNRNLVGTIAPEIGNLTELLVLELSNNQLTGPIPAEIGNLTKLEDLLLALNQLDGEIPPELGNLVALQRLILSNNNLEGEIPAELGELTALRIFDLSFNALSGEIPAQLGGLESVVIFNLRNNNLTGDIPTNLANLRNVQEINLRNNQLDGNIPEELGGLPALQALYLNNNEFTELPEINFVAGLNIFWVQGNKLTFEDLLPDNVLQDGITYTPQDSIGFERTVFLNVGESYTINLGIDNDVTDNVYTWFKDGVQVAVTDVNRLELANVDFVDEGEYTVVVTNPNAPFLELYGYTVTIIISAGTCALEDSLALISLYNSTDGANWFNPWPIDNDTISYRDWEGVTTNMDGCVTGLLVTNNNLVGTLPDSIGLLTSLDSLDLSGNEITGPIPPEIGNLANLRILELHTNLLNDTIPPEIGLLNNIDTLFLYNNQLEGEIPKELGNLVNASAIWLDDNQLSGELPEEIGKLLSIQHLSLRNNQLEGELPEEIGDLALLEILDLSDNMFEGGIPPEIRQLDNLRRLFLDNNSFNELPPEIANLTDLEIIDISFNQLMDLPDLTPLTTTIIHVNDNRLTFEDIIPENVIVLDTYHPQDSIGMGETVTLNIGDDYTIDLMIDQSIEDDPNLQNNTYIWYKDGVEIVRLNVNEFELTNVQLEDGGVYTVEVINPLAPELTLYSFPITIIIGGEVEISGPEQSCLDDTLSYTATPEDGNFNWEITGGQLIEIRNGSSEVLVVWDQPGAGTLLATNLDNNTNDLFEVAVGPALNPPEVVFPAEIQVGGDIGTLIASGDPDAVFEWYRDPELTDLANTGGNFTPNVNTTAPATINYYVTQTVGGCTSEAQLVSIEIVDVSADLAAIDGFVEPDEIITRTVFRAEISVRNIGERDAPATRLRVYLSTDNTFSPDDVEIGLQDILGLQPNQEDRRFFNLSIPENTPVGNYFIIFVADDENVVEEDDEVNNIFVVPITVVGDDIDITIMNVITPNGDGLNEVMYIENLDLFPDSEVTLIDKWGVQVFSVTNYQNDWMPVDVSGEILPAGNYICIVKFIETNREPIKEIIAIIRE